MQHSPQRLRAALVALLLLAVSARAADGSDVLPRNMAWSAYNLGTTGNSQAVAIGKMLKDRYGVNLRVLPGKNDVSRLLPLVNGRVQFSANGVATIFASEGVFQFAAENWGPLPLRLVMTSNGDSNQAVAVAADLGVKGYADLKGRRVPYVRGAPSLNVGTEAMLACGGLTWADVERVEFPGYQAMWDGVINDQVDAAFATTVSGPTRRLEASPRGIYWPPAPHADEACWAGIRRVAPYFFPHTATRGAGITAAAPHEGANYPYPLLTGLDSSDSAVVAALVMALHTHYDDYKDADPGAIGWALERQIFQWVVPYHEGAVAAFRTLGVWSEADQAHNDRLLARQALLGHAWQEMQGSDLEGEAFVEAWMTRRREALQAEGFDPIWH
ncbi:MAG: TAXI family TRAP transporter solute-binding subunit [Pseudomonadales bacterium]